MKHKIVMLLCVFTTFFSNAQSKLKGMVMVQHEGQMSGLEGASVYWLGTSIGQTTNDKGWFEISLSEQSNKLVISYVGYQTDTITVTSNSELHHLLREDNTLDEVLLETRKKTSSVSFLKPLNTIQINEGELLKAACCNLSESFETNPSVDVNYSDAVTGVKQIKMLGLTSPYLLITQENIPSVRGASQAYGVSFIPGTWISSIQVTKGMGSVVNGFESIAGQINTELKKPKNAETLYLNAYASGTGRFELNTHFNRTMNSKWSTGLYLHTNFNNSGIDRNKDLFLDIPLSKQMNVMNRWQYTDSEKGWVSFIDLKYVNDAKKSGQLGFDFDKTQAEQFLYGVRVNTERFETAAKLGHVFKDKPYQSFGIQTAYSNHKQNSFFGFNNYDINHRSMYVNSIFQSILSSTQHKYKTGINFTHDTYDEKVLLNNYQRNESSIGAFFEYTYDSLGDLILVAGLRIDKHNLLGWFATPRLHIRYEAWNKGVFKFAIGSGRRNANIFAENQKVFATSRDFHIEKNHNKAYGLTEEIAWNYGVSFLQELELSGKPLIFSADFFRTSFSNQTIVDYDNSHQTVLFYDLNGKSFSDAFQVEVAYEISGNMDLKMAYKNNNVKIAYKSGVLQKALQPKQRFFANLGYETKSNDKENFWKFDLTYNRVGEQRISNSSHYRFPEYSKAYDLLNMQVTKIFSKKFEVYMGGENITNYTQVNPVLGSDKPFDEGFDTSLVYAPVVGSMYYGGLRYKL
jgi:outer membrane receptor for ferrienterochelin and colicin